MQHIKKNFQESHDATKQVAYYKLNVNTNLQLKTSIKI